MALPIKNESINPGNEYLLFNKLQKIETGLPLTVILISSFISSSMAAKKFKLYHKFIKKAGLSGFFYKLINPLLKLDPAAELPVHHISYTKFGIFRNVQ